VRRGLVALVAVTPLAFGLASVACSKKEDAAPVTHAGGKAKIEYSVEVAPITLRIVGYVVTAPGAIQAFEQVQVTARVGGAVDKVLFAEGQAVKAGETLAVVEVDRYQVAVDQAKAQVAKTTAAEASAEAALNRRSASNQEHPGLIPGEEIATYQTTVQTAKADQQAANEALKVANLNLRDAYVRAPIAGVIQTRTVQTGQYLQPGTVLATLLQRDPLLLKFQVTEQDAPRIKPEMTATLSLRESSRSYNAKITLVAGSADPTSHLVAVTGEIDDKEHRYWLRPGAFCDVSIPVGSTRQAAVVPEIAIRASERGFLAYVVDGAVAHEKVVNLGMHTANGFVEVTSGLNAGDLLVVRGAEPLSEGAPVKINDRTTLEQFEEGGAPPPLATDGDGGAHGGGAGGGHRDGGGAPHAAASGSAP
jgi:RND family efflux transporter MFP subunit